MVKLFMNITMKVSLWVKELLGQYLKARSLLVRVHAVNSFHIFKKKIGIRKQDDEIETVAFKVNNFVGGSAALEHERDIYEKMGAHGNQIKLL